MSFFRSKPTTMSKVKASNPLLQTEPQPYYITGPIKTSQNLYPANSLSGPVRYVPTSSTYYRDAQFVQPPVAYQQPTISRRELLPMTASQQMIYASPPHSLPDGNWPGSAPTIRRAQIPVNLNNHQHGYMTLAKPPTHSRASVPIEFVPPHTHSRTTFTYPTTKVFTPVQAPPQHQFVPIERPVERSATVNQLKPLDMKQSQAIVWNPRKFEEFRANTPKATVRTEPDRFDSPIQVMPETMPYDDFKPKIVTDEAGLGHSSISSRVPTPAQIYDSSQVF